MDQCTLSKNVYLSGLSSKCGPYALQNCAFVKTWITHRYHTQKIIPCTRLVTVISVSPVGGAARAECGPCRHAHILATRKSDKAQIVIVSTKFADVYSCVALYMR